MKKIVAFFLAALMSISVALADGFDISSMSMEDLVKLHEAVEIELGIRKSDTVTYAYSGYYIVGVDIPAGHYAITCVKSESGYASVIVTVGDDFYTKKTVSATNCFDGGTCTVNLKDGEMLSIGGSATCIIEKLTGGLFID